MSLQALALTAQQRDSLGIQSKWSCQTPTVHSMTPTCPVPSARKRQTPRKVYANRLVISQWVQLLACLLLSHLSRPVASSLCYVILKIMWALSDRPAFLTANPQQWLPTPLKTSETCSPCTDLSSEPAEKSTVGRFASLGHPCPPTNNSSRHLYEMCPSL